MTDRFYPRGKASQPDVWKSTYEVQTEMRSYERSMFPPGTSIHQPGARERFGYATPGPYAHRLAQSYHALGEDVDVPNPREMHAVPRMQCPDDRETFEHLDVPEMTRSYRSPVAMATLTPGGKKFMTRGRSLPALVTPTAPKRLSEVEEPIDRIEDEHFSYFVPMGMRREGRERIGGTTLSKLHKEGRISFPFSGEGTGFRSQTPYTSWWPDPTPISNETSYRRTFQKYNVHRTTSPLHPKAMEG